MGFLFSPYGRISRRAYWLSWIVPYFIVAIAAVLLDEAAFPQPGRDAKPVFQLILALIAFWPSIAVTSKRLHDRGMSGWWLCLVVAPVVLLFVIAAVVLRMAFGSFDFGEIGAGAAPATLAMLIGDLVFLLGTVLWLFVTMCCLPGDKGPNKYGADPLNPGGDLKEVFS